MAKGREYDAVLMDIQMPKMDGLEAAQILREDRRLQNLPIIAMTAHALAEERDRFLEAGMNDHIAKPIDTDLMFETLARWISRKPGSGVSASAERQVVKEPQEPSRAKPNAAEPSVAKSVKDAAAFPDEITGIDLAEARKMVANNDALLRRLLADFHAKYMDHAVDIKKHLDAGDLEAAERLAHSLKGVSGNLRAERVFTVVKALDDRLLNDPSAQDIPALIEDLSLALDEVRQSLSRLDIAS